MRKRNVLAIAAASLVAGLVLGSIGLASAAPSTTASQTAGAGMRLGAAIRQSGATLADIVAKLTGRSVTDVRADRQAGKSFADIAEAKGVSSDKVVAETLVARKAALDAAVKDGRITQAQADTMLANMKARLGDRVDDTTAGCGGGGCGGGGRGLGRGGAGCFGPAQ